MAETKPTSGVESGRGLSAVDGRGTTANQANGETTFYEDDESVEKIKAAWENGEPGITGRMYSDDYRRGLRDAVTIVQKAVVPLGAYGGATDSPWNKGYTRARDEAVAALVVRLSMLDTHPEVTDV